MNQEKAELSPTVVQHLDRGDRVGAVKALRLEKNLSLKIALDQIKAWEAGRAGEMKDKIDRFTQSIRHGA